MVLRYRQVPFEERLNYKDVSGTFCYDEAGKMLHSKWHGDIAGTLCISHVKDSAEIAPLSTALPGRSPHERACG
jgi:hypothetical protein